MNQSLFANLEFKKLYKTMALVVEPASLFCFVFQQNAYYFV